MRLLPPLKIMKLTQPFGHSDHGIDYMAAFGMKGHNGLDLRAPIGTEVYASCDGKMEFTRGGQGYGNEARIYNPYGYEVIYAHLSDFIGESREVKAGERIAFSGNTGFSTGPHLHFGLRRFTETSDGSRQVQDGGNGYKGGIDPTPFFAEDPFLLPVDKQYGLTPMTPGVPSELEWYKTNAWYIWKFRRPMTTRMMKALRYGFWDLRTVLDDSMVDVWQQMHKPEAIKRGIIKG